MRTKTTGELRLYNEYFIILRYYDYIMNFEYLIEINGEKFIFDKKFLKALNYS